MLQIGHSSSKVYSGHHSSISVSVKLVTIDLCIFVQLLLFTQAVVTAGYTALCAQCCSCRNGWQRLL
jgi:hypothetical protein